MSSVLVKKQRLKTPLPRSANSKRSGLTHIPVAKTTLQLCFSIAKPIERSRSQDQYSQVRSMFCAHPDIPATCIFPGQITDHTRNPTGTALMKHPKNPMETVMEPFRTRDIANLGKTLTKDTTDRDTLLDRRIDDLLTCTNRQIEPSIACNRYLCTKASSSSSNHHTQMWIANQLYCSTPSSQPESRTLTCTHGSSTDRLLIMASKKNMAKNCTTTSRHSTSIAKASSKTKRIRRTTTHIMDPMTFNKSSMMMTSMPTTSKSVLQHAANAPAALPSKTPYTSIFEKYAWGQNQQNQKNQNYTGQPRRYPPNLSTNLRSSYPLKRQGTQIPLNINSNDGSTSRPTYNVPKINKLKCTTFAWIQGAP